MEGIRVGNDVNSENLMCLISLSLFWEKGGGERSKVDGTFGPAGSILCYLVWVCDKGISDHFWACGFWIGFPFLLSLE